MRIGVLTFHRAYNYGAFLQALALKSFLVNRGHSVVFIDYQSEAHTNSYNLINRDLFLSLGLRGKISQIIKGLLKAPRQIKRYSKMKRLQRKYLGVSGKPKTRLEDLDSTSLDVIIYGSDQIWRKSPVNPNSSFDPIYWGEGFDNVKKITYAASMGVMDLSPEDKVFIKENLNSFKGISCREGKLAQEISLLTGKRIHQVLDPVFLMNEMEWERLIPLAKRTVNQRKYVLVYNLMQSEDVRILANQIAQERGLQVVEITGSVKPYSYNKNILQTKDAFDFLSYIKNADFVVASSFHAIAFSILFKRNFYALGLNHNSERVSSLLNVANLSERLLIDGTISRVEDIDYTQCNLLLDIEESKDYLKASLEYND